MSKKPLFSILMMLSLVAFVMLPAALAETKSPAAPRKKLIAFGGLDWYSPANLQMNIRKYEELPFDGTVLSGFRLNAPEQEVMFDWECFGQRRFERAQLTDTIETLKNIDFQKYTDNFLRYNLTPGIDWFDDFGAALHNARLWAEVTKETGMKGWMFDVEDYSGIKDTNFTYKRKKYAKEKTFEQYEAQARLRGREFMQAVQEGMPDIVLLLTLAHSYVQRAPNASQRLAELDDYGLLPAFVNGMIDAAGPNVRIIDGHEQAYGYWTETDFKNGYRDARQGALSLVPQELREKYKAKMEVGMAAYINSILALTGYPGHWAAHYLSPEDRLKVIESAVYHGLNTADEYQWFYSESMVWAEPGARWPTPPGTMDAVRSARRKVESGEPLGFDVTEKVAAARKLVAEANPYPTRDTVVPRVSSGKEPPKVDGLLDDDAWKDLAPMHPFAPADARATTTAHVIVDDEHLFISFRCVGGAEPGAAGEQKDGDGVRRGDYVSVSLMANTESLPFQFMVNPANAQWDGRGDFPEWNAEWASGTKATDREWTAELAIPWSALGENASPRSMRAFFVRHRAAGDKLNGVVQELIVAPASPAASE